MQTLAAAVLATILYIYGGKPFYMGAKDEFNSKAPGMMSLITLGITVFMPIVFTQWLLDM